MDDELEEKEHLKDDAARSVIHTRGPERKSIFQAIALEVRIRPTVSCMVFASIVAGTSALVLGSAASRAFTVIGGQGADAYIARFMGAAFLIGGILAMTGVTRQKLFIEMLGLGLIAGGAFIYASALFVGLGLNGLIAGTFALGLCVGTALRIRLLTRAARRLYPPS
jgi:hypothetical protein